MLLVDTNVWLAAADRRARRHSECLALINAHRGALASTAPVIAETGWLLLDRDGPNAQQEFIGSILTGDITVIATLDERDFRIVRPAHIDAFDLLPGPA